MIYLELAFSLSGYCSFARSFVSVKHQNKTWLLHFLFCDIWKEVDWACKRESMVLDEAEKVPVSINLALVR